MMAKKADTAEQARMDGEDATLRLDLCRKLAERSKAADLDARDKRTVWKYSRQNRLNIGRRLKRLLRWHSAEREEISALNRELEAAKEEESADYAAKELAAAKAVQAEAELDAALEKMAYNEQRRQ